MVTDACQRALDHVDADRLVKLAMDLVDIPSPTGSEKAVADFIYEKYQEFGLNASLQRAAEERYNVIGVLPGTGGGPTLMFCGHMDTSHTGEETVLEGEGYKCKSRIVEDKWIYGNGIFNMKSGVAGFTEAALAIKEANVLLKGDIILAAVVGEIEKAPVDEFQGEEYAGYGTGAKYLLSHGVTADMCIIAEPSGLRVIPGHLGTTWVKITTKGTFAHTAFAERAINANDKMIVVLNALEQWIPEYRQRYNYQGLHPMVNIGAIRGGWPWRASRTAVSCSVYLDVRTVPGVLPIDVKTELVDLMRDLQSRDANLKVEVETYVSAPATEISVEEPVVKAVCAAHEIVHGKPAEIATQGPYSDAAHFNRYGIPSLNYGAGGRLKTSEGYGWDAEEGEYQYIEDVIAGAKAYVAAAVDICSKDRTEVLLR